MCLLQYTIKAQSPPVLHNQQLHGQEHVHVYGKRLKRGRTGICNNLRIRRYYGNQPPALRASQHFIVSPQQRGLVRRFQGD